MKRTRTQNRSINEYQVRDNVNIEVIDSETGMVSGLSVPWYIIMDALEDGLSVDGLLIEIQEFIDAEYSPANLWNFTPEADAKIREMHAQYAAGGVLSDEESHRRGFYEGKSTVKITRSQLRRIIREEKARLQEVEYHGSPMSDAVKNLMAELMAIRDPMQRRAEIYMLIDELEDMANRG